MPNVLDKLIVLTREVYVINAALEMGQGGVRERPQK